jgi:hypothetical protein
MKIFEKPLYIGIILTVITIVITGQSFLLKTKTFQGEIEYTHYNNYKIFKESYFHLVEKQDLYQLYPKEHWDYYKYSPTFALFMAPFAYLPDFLGLLFWNLLNVLMSPSGGKSLAFRRRLKFNIFVLCKTTEKHRIARMIVNTI